MVIAMTVLRGVLMLAAAVGLFFTLIPTVVYGMFHIGVAALILLTAACVLQFFLLGGKRRCQSAWEIFSGKGRYLRFFRRLLGALLALFFVAEAVFSGFMLYYAWGNPPDYTKAATAIVPGCLVKGNAPSKMLASRLEYALLYLTQTPAAMVVVTGGQGPDEEYPEAEVAARWLTERGVDPQRILIENTSADTYKNFENAAGLMAAKGLAPEVVVFTDGYHQLRSQHYAARHGLSPTGVPSVTPWGLLPTYWLREQAALCEVILIEWGLAPPEGIPGAW